ncbi:hypothetical protein BKA57DRAFT_317370 [Linnemannia elongata]|nr:hypothetical protein BKA57DRAFT_317370 [Linnemannia elongata]
MQHGTKCTSRVACSHFSFMSWPNYEVKKRVFFFLPSFFLSPIPSAHSTSSHPSLDTAAIDVHILFHYSGGLFVWAALGSCFISRSWPKSMYCLAWRCL